MAEIRADELAVIVQEVCDRVGADATFTTNDVGNLAVFNPDRVYLAYVDLYEGAIVWLNG